MSEQLGNRIPDEDDTVPESQQDLTIDAETAPEEAEKEWRDSQGRTFEGAIVDDYYNAPRGSLAQDSARRMMWGD